MSSLKLEFLTEVMEYLRPVLRETKTVEETAEAIIPDSCPDVSEILYTGGLSFLRGKELGEGSAAVSMGVSASVLAQPDGRAEPEVVEVYIPLSLRMEHPMLKPGLLSCVQVQLRRLDSHMVNPRKVLVRATVAVTMWVWENCREEHPTAASVPDVELLEKKEPLKLLTTMGEKNYTVEDAVRLNPEGGGKVLADYQIEITHTDARLTGTRAVLKGNAEITALYLNEAGTLETGRAQLPFSQYIDLGDCRETDELRLSSCLTGAEVELSADGGGLNVTLQMLSRAEVWATQELSYLGDLYAIQGQAVPEWENRSYESLLDRQYFAPVGRGSLAGGGDQAVHLTCMPGELSHTRAGEMTEFTLPVNVQVLSRQEDRLRGGNVRVNLTCTTQAAQGCRFEAEVEELTAAASPGADGMDVKVTGTLCISTYGLSEIQEIAGGEVVEMEQQKDRPGLIIRRPAPQESLWDIAKQYRTTMAAIEKANGLVGEPGVDTLLLIPGR